MRRRAWEDENAETDRITGNLIGVCVNSDCAYYRDIKKIKNWKVEKVEIPENPGRETTGYTFPKTQWRESEVIPMPIGDIFEKEV